MWGRLASIANYIAITTFGTEHHAEQTIAAVRRVHESITGTMPDGTPYAANDPHLLGWVHAAEIDSFLVAHQRYGLRPLVSSEIDEYVAQTAEVARRLGVLDPPTSGAALRQTLADYRPELAGTEAARDAIHFLLRHPDLPLAARPAYLSLAAAAVGVLPRWARNELGLPDVPIADRTVGRALGAAATSTIRWAMAPGHAHARQLHRRASAAG
jgi:uncharacterized protein (DUF2236 family)